MKLSIDILVELAKEFCEIESGKNHIDLLGVTDGKAVGTYVEHKFQAFIASRYDVEIGSSAKGIDLPEVDINTDIKVTSIRQPQSSCPFKSAEQKIFGLGYNLLVFIYEKYDNGDFCRLKFHNCTFIEKERTADFTLTKMIRQLIDIGGSHEDLFAHFESINLPGDEIEYNRIIECIFEETPKQGYLTISNALQWRLQYKRVIDLDNTVDGVRNFTW